MYLLAIGFITAVMGVLIYSTWGNEPNAELWLCIAYIPITLLVFMSVVFLLLKAVHGPPFLRSPLTVRQVMTVVESVLDRHGIEWTERSYADHARDLGAEPALARIGRLPTGTEPYVISIESGRIIVRPEQDYSTFMTVNPKDTFSPQLMKDIAEALE